MQRAKVATCGIYQTTDWTLDQIGPWIIPIDVAQLKAAKLWSKHFLLNN